MCKRKQTNLFVWVPGNGLDILGVLHHDRYTFKIGVRLHYTEKTSISRTLVTTRLQFNLPSQTHTLLSLEQLASKAPSLENPTDLHSLSCPSNVDTHSHSFSFPSSTSPSEFIPAGLYTPCAPSSSSSSSSESGITSSHTPTVESKLPLANVRPSGDHAILLTVLLCSVSITLARQNTGWGSSLLGKPPDEEGRM